MRFYTRVKSKIHHRKNPFLSTIFLLRDIFIYVTPIKTFPRILVKILYGFHPQFVFFVHPRRSEDAYVALPILGIVRRFFGKTLFFKILFALPPVVVGTIRTKQGVNGLIISSPLMPEFILNNRRLALKESVKGLHFSSKLVSAKSVFGLGALWPMVTRRGLTLKRYLKTKRITITNGHSGTLISLFLMVKKILAIANIPMDKSKIAILGVGKMGTNLARVLYGKVAAITLIDIHQEKLNRVEAELKNDIANTDIQKYTNDDEISNITTILGNNHIVVCTTSNLRRIIRPDEIPDNTIIIDDSRPEAIPRESNSDSKIIIEGGLMKIKDIKQNYDFGFGIDENVFGCLAESFLIANNTSSQLKPTLGNVDLNNFNEMLNACANAGVDVGDFKCKNTVIDHKKIISVLQKKTDLIATIPFKKICWILRTHDLQ